MKIFNVPMTTGPRSEWWALAFGEWRLVVMPAVSKANGFWWAIETRNGSTTIKSDYRQTPELAAAAIEAWLLAVAGLVDELKARGAREITNSS